MSDLMCAVCIWKSLPEDWHPAVTICNGTAVCDGHLHLTTSDPTVLIARRFDVARIPHYQEPDDE